MGGTTSGEFCVISKLTGEFFSESEIDSKLQKVKGHIEHLSNAQSHRRTHGGKKFRGRQISLRNQIDDSKERLDLLKSAKEMIVKYKKERAAWVDPYYRKLSSNEKYANLHTESPEFINFLINLGNQCIAEAEENVAANYHGPEQEEAFAKIAKFQEYILHSRQVRV